MRPAIRSSFAWFLPFLVGGGMGLGAIIGMTSFSDKALQEGPAGDTAGAAGALVVLLCVAVGFAMAVLTVSVAKVLHRSAPGHILLRTGLSIVGGGFIGALAPSSGTLTTAAVWLVLLGIPVLLSWSGRPPAPCGVNASGSNRSGRP